MKYLDFEVRNLCQFEHVRVEFSPGLNALVGPNGAGKSNLLKLVYAALTGDFSRNSGVKKDNIRAGADKADPAWCRLRFEHAGKTYSLERDVRNEKQTLTLPDGSKVTRDALINEAMAKILGVGPSILDEYVMVDQWRLFDFLEVTPAKRAQAFAKLFGTEDMERLHASIGKLVGIVVTPFSDDVLAAAEADKVNAEAERDRIDARGKELWVELATLSEENLRAKAVVEAVQRRRSLEAQLRQAEESVRSGEASAAAMDAQIEAEGAAHAELAGTLRDCAPHVSKAEEVIRRWDDVRRAAEAKADVERQIEETKKVWSAPEPTKPEGYVSDLNAGFLKELEERRRLVDDYARFLGTFNGQTAACPTCHTPVQNLLGSIEQARRELPALREDVRRREEAWNLSTRFDADQAAHCRRLDEASRRMDILQARLSDLAASSTPDMPLGDARQLLETYREVEADVRASEARLAQLRQDRARVGGILAGAEKFRREAEAELASLPPAEAADPALAAMAEFAAKDKEYSVLLGQSTYQAEAVRKAAERLQWLRDENAKLARKVAHQEHLARIRDVLHRDNLPRLIANSRLREMERMTNEMLACFSSPFLVRANEDLSFSTVHPDGKVQSAARLSGGEKMVLAISFRLCVNLEFAREVGLLCLDEPTVGLDYHNIKCLRTALVRLREISSERGLQVVIITHEADLGPLFDKVVDLSNSRGANDQIDS